jgi:hypothetical protein
LEAQLEEAEAAAQDERTAAASEAATRQARLEALAGAVVAAEQRFKDELAAAAAARAAEIAVEVAAAEARGQAAAAKEASAAASELQAEVASLRLVCAEGLGKLSARDADWKAVRAALDSQADRHAAALLDASRDEATLRAECKQRTVELDALRAEVPDRNRCTHSFAFGVFFLIKTYLNYLWCQSGAVSNVGL